MPFFFILHTPELIRILVSATSLTARLLSLAVIILSLAPLGSMYVLLTSSYYYDMPVPPPPSSSSSVPTAAAATTTWESSPGSSATAEHLHQIHQQLQHQQQNYQQQQQVEVTMMMKMFLNAVQNPTNATLLEELWTSVFLSGGQPSTSQTVLNAAAVASGDATAEPEGMSEAAASGSRPTVAAGARPPLWYVNQEQQQQQQHSAQHQHHLPHHHPYHNNPAAAAAARMISPFLFTPLHPHHPITKEEWTVYHIKAILPWFVSFFLGFIVPSSLSIWSFIRQQRQRIERKKRRKKRNDTMLKILDSYRKTLEVNDFVVKDNDKNGVDIDIDIDEGEIYDREEEENENKQKQNGKRNIQHCDDDETPIIKVPLPGVPFMKTPPTAPLAAATAPSMTMESCPSPSSSSFYSFGWHDATAACLSVTPSSPASWSCHYRLTNAKLETATKKFTTKTDAGGVRETTISSTSTTKTTTETTPTRNTASRHVTGTCAICLNHYELGETIAWSPNPACVHCFHQDCIQSWLLRGNNSSSNHVVLAPTTADPKDQLCPCCRQPFVVQKEPEDDMRKEQPQDHQQQRQQQQQRPLSPFSSAFAAALRTTGVGAGAAGGES